MLIKNGYNPCYINLKYTYFNIYISFICIPVYGIFALISICFFYVITVAFQNITDINRFSFYTFIPFRLI